MTNLLPCTDNDEEVDGRGLEMMLMEVSSMWGLFQNKAASATHCNILRDGNEHPMVHHEAALKRARKLVAREMETLAAKQVIKIAALCGSTVASFAMGAFICSLKEKLKVLGKSRTRSPFVDI